MTGPCETKPGLTATTTRLSARAGNGRIYAQIVPAAVAVRLASTRAVALGFAQHPPGSRQPRREPLFACTVAMVGLDSETLDTSPG